MGAFLKLQVLTPDAKLRAEMNPQVNALRQKNDGVRYGLGVYCMSHVRSILPPETEPPWARLGQTLEARAASSPRKSLWRALDDKMEARESDNASEKTLPAEL